jgi:hypothetical protein
MAALHDLQHQHQTVSIIKMMISDRENQEFMSSLNTQELADTRTVVFSKKSCPVHFIGIQGAHENPWRTEII